MVKNVRVVDLNSPIPHYIHFPADVIFFSEIKIGVARAGGLAFEDQLLLFQDTLLREEEKLSDHSLVEGDTILLYKKTNVAMVKIMIERRQHGRSFNVEMPSTSTVNNLKRLINYKVGVPPARQSLTTLRVEMREEDMIRDYAASQTLSVTLVERPRGAATMTLLIKDGKDGVGEIEVDVGDNVNTVMAEMRDWEVIGGRPYYLEFQGTMLEGNLTILGLGIHHLDVISLVVWKVE